MKFKDLSKFLCLLFLMMAPMSCSSDTGVEDQTETFVKSIQAQDINKCIEMSYNFQAKLATIQNEPKFKINKLVTEISTDIRRTILNKYTNDNIIYVFSFPCQWKILETKRLNQSYSNGMLTTTSEICRVFLAVSYNSMEDSPISTPLITKDQRSQYNIKEMIVHCDFDPETRLYLGWGLDSYTKW